MADLKSNVAGTTAASEINDPPQLPGVYVRAPDWEGQAAVLASASAH
ncbi:MULTISPECIES: hypothetical protein [Cupriavidus]